MPLYRVAVCDHLNQTIEEIYHATQRAYHYMVYAVEADSEEEAQEIVESGNADHIVEEDWDYGDILDSEFYENGDVLDENYIETEIEEIETDEEWAERVQAEIEEQRRRMAQWRAQAAQTMGIYARKVKPTPKIPSNDEAIWEV